MSSAKLHKLTATGKATASGSIDLPDQVFGIEPNAAVMHQVVTAQLAARRSGTQSTKTRAEVRGGGAKPWRQKGTGRARQGSIRSPQWEGGGVALGPKPRSYAQKTPRKMRRLALCSALSDRARGDRLIVVDEWNFDEPKTKSAVAVLDALKVRPTDAKQPRVLIVLDHTEEAAWKSFRNLGDRVQLVIPRELNPYDVLSNDYIIFSRRTIADVSTRLTGVASEGGSAE